MAFSNGLDMARQNQLVTVEELAFMVPDYGGAAIFRVDVGDDGNGYSEIENIITHTADGRIAPISRALNGKEGLISRNFMPHYRTLEYVLRGLMGLPTSDTTIDTGTRRQIIWTYPVKSAPAVATNTGYYGVDTASVQLLGGKLQSFNIDVVRNDTGGSVSGNIVYHYNRVVTYLAPVPNSVQASNVQTLTFTAVPAGQQLALRKAGTTTLSAAFTAADNNTVIKARVEALYGATATSTGTLTTATDGVTGETLYSGTLAITFSGALANTALAQMEVVTGEVQQINITGAATVGTYAGATVTVGDASSAVQTAIRAVAGNYSAVVVGGTSV